MTTHQQKSNFMAGKHWIIVLIILGAGYGSYSGLRDLLQSQKERQKWTNEDKQILINNCIRDSKDMAVKYPELTKDYCKCSTERIQAKLTKYQYIEIIEKPISEQTKVLLPVFQDCLTEYKNKIKQSGG
jgi:hypothetical protein